MGMTAASLVEMGCFESVPENFRSGAELRRHQIRRHKAVPSPASGLTGNVLDYGCGYADTTDPISKRHPVMGVTFILAESHLRLLNTR